ncbi:hypothetical protein [Paenibacillus sp. Root444D2]|uniref:hypothetical protein n=1 Tax=Paenibacillus sp. Root444D2 TaxID=1736538 RepID=UPI00070FB120|nr:hypothetical protein [Paenibacillus sp. Root444D2]KQX69251.1 hypothetical protein ASD40_01755 [Paenibacillus sp. Root444D2]
MLKTAFFFSIILEGLLIGGVSWFKGEFTFNIYWVGGSFVVIFLILLGLAANEEEKETAQKNYRNALDILSRDPKNPQLRQNALDCGRRYYSSLRDNGRLTIYDEQAITNDILAAG